MTEFAAHVVWLLGIPALARAINRNRVAILLYHDPDPSIFDEHLKYLGKHYNIVPFRRVVDSLRTGDWANLPQNPVVVHIDDGYRRNVELAPICARHDVEPTIYVCSHVVSTSRRFWSKLAGGRSKQLRLVENSRLLEKLREEADFSPEREYEGRTALSADELSMMAPQFDIQSHGRYHFSLLTLDDTELREELESSRRRIEGLTMQLCEHFSFPYGDCSPREILAAKAAGYKTARTTLPGWVGPNSDPFQLPIVADVPGEISTNQLRLQLTGLPRLFKRSVYTLLTKHLYAVRERILMSRRFF